MVSSQIDVDAVISNSDSVNLDMIAEVEAELQDSPYDLTSLVFLLYNVPDTALQRLIVYQQVSKDIGNNTNFNMNFLLDWFQNAKNTSTWKHEFVEALLTCQLHGIVRKLGFNVSDARRFYQTDNLTAKTYINPMKKALYKLCENINSDNLEKLKKSLKTYEIDTMQYESCELILLKLMCEKFITVNQFHYNKKVFGYQVEIEKLLRIIRNLPDLKKITVELSILQISLNDQLAPMSPVTTSTPSTHLKVDESNQEQQDKMYPQDMDDTFAMLHDVKDFLKSDGKKLDSDKSKLQNFKRIGTCAIINQEEFYPSKYSIQERGQQSSTLETRVGSTRDKIILERTMTSLNFEVTSTKNLDHKQMFEFIGDVIRNKVRPDDRMFVLCILSHGVRGHVCAADSVKVKMDDIQNLLEEAINLRNKPKLIIVQACQVEDEPQPMLMADSPLSNYKLKKTNFLICWATAPELNAYRYGKNGSIFIQILCETLKEFAEKEHLFDIFTIVTKKVTKLCEIWNIKQVPIIHSTLTDKIYLCSNPP